MKLQRIDLLTLLISLFILNGCKNPENIGLPLNASQALQTNLLDTVTINTVTMPDDSVETSQTDGALAYYLDPIFGLTQADIATSVSLPGSSAFTLPATLSGIFIDSAVLVLPYKLGFSGDLSTSYNINVYQLSEPVIDSKAYFNTKQWQHQSTPLVSLNFSPKPTDSISIIDIVTGAPDTAKKVGPQLRIPINTNFIYQNFFNASTTQLSNNVIYQNAIKGLYITLSNTQLSSSHPGGSMFFDMTGGTSEIEIYYHYTDTNAAIDTIVTSLPLGTPHAGYIKYGYQQTAANFKPVADITTQIADHSAKASYNTLYLQGLAGLRGRISFPYLNNVTKNLGKIALNRADLEITPDTTRASYNLLPPVPRLTMYRWDIAHQRVEVPDASSADVRFISVGTFDGYYDPYQTHKAYHFIITGYIQDLMSGKLTDYGTFIAPTDTTGTYAGTETINVSNTAQIGGRAVVGGSKNSPVKMKLNLLYNKIN